jgi:starch synthase
MAASPPDRISFRLVYDERLEHLIEAGTDMFLMPSRFEPCGLNQLNSLRYGTLPIVRATGGLDDTVVDADTPNGRGTGFKFLNYTPEALLATLQRALHTYRSPDGWAALQKRAMQEDFSWDNSAREYVKVYSATS